MFFLEIDLNCFLMRLPSSDFAQKIDFKVTYSLQVLNVGKEIQALFFGMNYLGSFSGFLLG